MKQRIRYIALTGSLLLTAASLWGQTALFDSLKVAVDQLEGEEQIAALESAAYRFENSSLEKALYFVRLREKLVRESGNDSLIAENQKLFGHMYLESGLYDSAEKYYMESLSLFKFIRDYNGIATLTHNLGLVYLLTNDTIKCVDYFRQSIDARLETGNTRRIGDGYTTLGEIYLRFGLYDRSTLSLLEALPYYADQGSYRRKYDCLAYLADNMIATDPPKALRWIREMEELYNITPRYPSITRSKIDFRLGQYHLAMGRVNEAADYFDSLLIKNTYLNSEYRTVETLRLMSDKLHRSGQMEKSLWYSETARRIFKVEHDSITKEILTSFKTRLDLRSTEEEIARTEELNKVSLKRIRTEEMAKTAMIAVVLVLLATVVTLLINFISIRKSQARLAGRLKELELAYENNLRSKEKILRLRENKNIFFNILTDKLLSPFTELTNKLTNLSAEARGSFRKELFITKMEGINRFALKVEKSLKRILVWSKLQRGQYEVNTELISVNDYLHELLPEILKMAVRNNLKVRFDIDPAIKVMFDRKSFRNIIKIIIENSIDVSAPGGEIIVRGKMGNNGSIISITDFGKGIPAEQQATLFDINRKQSAPPADNEIRLGLGLLMARHLAELNNSYLSFDSNPKRGTTFYLHIKEKDGK